MKKEKQQLAIEHYIKSYEYKFKNKTINLNDLHYEFKIFAFYNKYPAYVYNMEQRAFLNRLLKTNMVKVTDVGTQYKRYQVNIKY